LKLEETKELLRHSNVQTTSDIYGGLSLEAKREAQARLVEFVHLASRSPKPRKRAQKTQKAVVN